ncbi:MAG: bifunctional diguanylate cyclase/phosphodiesterase [Christensenella sp.]|uniref:bifunctional diguanylate cyclase/phosphodiesterase n=1 Tax=Christensenella sp. TaxID=1935934 RepID=UPI002B2107B0|nr:bifunctional diguanylate cyclase/phosphodiesterase [Christensenella sp.]MEA5003694.1 bifunctional diguanylate cyclase/phosphodiesterase [Christensenella sp.]
MPNNDEKVLFQFLKDILYNTENEQILDISKLSAEFRDLGEGLNFLSHCVTEAREYATGIANGDFIVSHPAKDNPLCWPLKSLCSNLAYMTWQIRQITQGDYNQHIEFMGEFSEAFNLLTEQLKQREYNLALETKRAEDMMKLCMESNDFMQYLMNRFNEPIIIFEENSDRDLYKNSMAVREEKEHPKEMKTLYSKFSSLEGDGMATIDIGKDIKYQVYRFPIVWKNNQAYAYWINLNSEATDTAGEQNSIYDSLTGVFNREFYYELIDEAVEQEAKFTVCYVGFDFLEKLNSMESDQFVKDVASSLQQCFGNDGYVCRIDKCDFIVKLRNYSDNIAILQIKKSHGILKKAYAKNMHALRMHYKVTEYHKGAYEASEKILSDARQDCSFIEPSKVIRTLPQTERDSNIEYDPITHFPTFSVLQKTMSKGASAQKNGKSKKLAILYADILNFKTLNDYYSFSEGDRQLLAFADFLRQNLNVYVGTRILSDFFIIIFTLDKGETLEKKMVELNKRAEKFLQQQRSYHPKCKIEIVGGICPIALDTYKGMNDALDHANIARKLAKTDYNTKFLLYDDHMQQKQMREAQLVSKLKTLLQNDEFEFFLQPQVDVQTGKIVSAEALCRLPQKGTVLATGPSEFLSLMERNGSIVDMDFQIYEKVCQYLRNKLDQGKPVVPISLNLSRIHMQHSDLVEKICQLTQRYEIDPSLLMFELTENIFFDSYERAIKASKELREHGYRISMDDYGSGYSSEDLLLNINFDELKLDRSFVLYLSQEEKRNRTNIVLSSLIEMAKQLSMTIVCEGVETEEQLKMVKGLGVDLVQGYYFMKPVDVTRFELFWELNDGRFQLPRS